MRLIDADALSVRIMTSSSLTDDFFGAGLQRGLDIAIEEIQEMPTIDAEPVKHGHWYYDKDIKEIKCSRCHIGIPYDIDGCACSVSELMEDDKYCYNCGAKMDEVSE